MENNPTPVPAALSAEEMIRKHHKHSISTGHWFMAETESCLRDWENQQVKAAVEHWASLYQNEMEENAENKAALNYWRGEGSIDAKIQSQLSAKDQKIAELERENARMKDFSTLSLEEFKQIYTYPELLKVQEQLNEKLMKLHESLYYSSAMYMYKHMYPDMHIADIQSKIQDDWQSYCTEHGLTDSPT